MAIASIKLLSKNKKEILASEMIDADKLKLTLFRQLEYTINYYNDTERKSRSLKVLIHKSDTNIAESLFAMFGDVLDVSISFLVVGGELVVRVENKEVFPLTFMYSRKILT